MHRLTSTERSSPLRDTAGRATETFQYLDVRTGELPEGWRLSSEIVNDPEAVRDLLDEVGRLYQMNDRQVAASFLVMGYAWQLMTGALACFFLDRRVPDLAASSVAVNLSSGVGFLPPRFFALTDDPDAGHPDAVLLDNAQELRAMMVNQLAAHHAEPLFANLRAVAPFGTNGMWANYIDRLASAILWLAEQLGDDDLARQEVPRFVELAKPRARTGLLEIQKDGHSRPFIKRGGCCLNYRLPGREKCDTCCLRPLEERIVLLQKHVVSASD